MEKTKGQINTDLKNKQKEERRVAKKKSEGITVTYVDPKEAEIDEFDLSLVMLKWLKTEKYEKGRLHKNYFCYDHEDDYQVRRVMIEKVRDLKTGKFNKEYYIGGHIVPKALLKRIGFL